MILHEARSLARDLLRRHGLADWTFRFDRATRRFGSCRPGERTITLSAPLTALNDEAQVRDTILHEIAHALTPGDGHGARWRAACRRIGAAPVRCYREGAGAGGVLAPPRPPAPYRMGCPTCGWWADRRRLPRARLACRACSAEILFRDARTGECFRAAAGKRVRSASTK